MCSLPTVRPWVSLLGGEEKYMYIYIYISIYIYRYIYTPIYLYLRPGGPFPRMECMHRLKEVAISSRAKHVISRVHAPVMLALIIISIIIISSSILLFISIMYLFSLSLYTYIYIYIYIYINTHSDSMYGEGVYGGGAGMETGRASPSWSSHDA